LSLSYTVSHNSSVLVGFKKTDAITALSLVYTFVPEAPVPPAPAHTDNSAVAPAIPPPGIGSRGIEPGGSGTVLRLR
jgi:hypothetical protein